MERERERERERGERERRQEKVGYNIKVFFVTGVCRQTPYDATEPA